MKKLLFVFLLLFSANSIARYSMFLCTKGTDAYSCSGSCKKVENASTDFKINIQKNTVIFLQYTKNKLDLTETLEMCKIVDSKNWECDNNYGMIEGQWYSRSKEIARNNPNVDYGMCGKYSIFE